MKRRPFSFLAKLGTDFLGFVLFGGKTPSLPRSMACLFLIWVKTFAPSRLVLRRSPAPLPVLIVVVAFLHYNPTVADGRNSMYIHICVSLSLSLSLSLSFSLSLSLDIYIDIYPNISPRVGHDTRSLFRAAGLNLEMSFF